LVEAADLLRVFSPDGVRPACIRTVLDLPKGILGIILTLHTSGEYLDFFRRRTTGQPVQISQQQARIS
jgi:hypothetical protein